MKRLFDIVSSSFWLLFLSPLMLLIALFIKLDSKGPIFYKAERIGVNEKLFLFMKFRTMHPNSDSSPITIGDNDSRITRIGFFLRKYKLDELPQLWNVIRGHISLVGPRPDVPKYKEVYKNYFEHYYQMKPGITCYSTIYFRDESKLYVGARDPEKIYVEQTIPMKVELDKKYYKNMNFFTDVKIVLDTLYRIVRPTG